MQADPAAFVSSAFCIAVSRPLQTHFFSGPISSLEGVAVMKPSVAQPVAWFIHHSFAWTSNLHKRTMSFYCAGAHALQVLHKRFGGGPPRKVFAGVALRGALKERPEPQMLLVDGPCPTFFGNTWVGLQYPVMNWCRRAHALPARSSRAIGTMESRPWLMGAASSTGRTTNSSSGLATGTAPIRAGGT